MHLAVFAEEGAVGIEDRAGVVVDAGGAALEDGNDENDLFFLRDLCEGFVAGPGTGSARLKRSGSSLRQKYSLRKSSWSEMICAPRAEASRIFSMARERFSSALRVQRICTRPTVNLLAIFLV